LTKNGFLRVKIVVLGPKMATKTDHFYAFTLTLTAASTAKT
jgi:hypothetical protein